MFVEVHEPIWGARGRDDDDKDDDHDVGTSSMP
jgi:hypothetical protein